MDDKKKYIVPEVEIVNFTAEDIITVSLTDGGEATGEWNTNDNHENMY